MDSEDKTFILCRSVERSLNEKEPTASPRVIINCDY